MVTVISQEYLDNYRTDPWYQQFPDLVAKIEKKIKTGELIVIPTHEYDRLRGRA